MATHGTSVMLSQAVADIRQCMVKVDNHIADNRGDKAVEEVITLQRQNVAVLEMLIARCDYLQMQNDNLTSGMRNSHSSRKPLPECKTISILKILGSNKSDFKSWNEKFINAIAQAARTPWRKFMMNSNKQLDQDRKVLTTQE